MTINVADLAAKMLTAFSDELSDKWPEIKSYAEAETKKLAENFVLIEKLLITGEINEQQAKLHHDIQKNATRTVLLTVEGLGIVAVEQAINAAMDALKDTVNTALNFTLL